MCVDLCVFDRLVGLGPGDDHNTIMDSAQKVSDQELFLKVVTLGDAGVGKSSLIFRYIDDVFQTGYVSTIGVDFKIKKVNVGNRVVKMQIWDTAGQERFRSIAVPYLRGAHGCVGVFDVTEPKTLEALKAWLREYRQINLNAPSDTLIIVGNKADLPPPHVPKEQIDSLISEFHCLYIEASAKTGSEVSTVFDSLAASLLSHRSLLQSRNDVVKPSPPSRSWFCCSA